MPDCHKHDNVSVIMKKLFLISRKISHIAFLLVICVVIALPSACTRRPRPAPQVVAEADPTVVRLAEAADRAASALEVLASIENERNPVNLPPLASNAPTQLRRGMTVNWAGPAEPLINKIADRASYEFYVSGSNPASPLVVTINVRNKPLIEILRDLGLQIGERGTLKVDANQKIIELSYANVAS